MESQTIRPYSELTLTEAEQCLEALMTATVKIGLKTSKWTRKRWKRYRDGWGPTMVADQAHLHFIEYLRANLGNSNRRHWPHRTALRHIHQAALKWERKIKWIFRNDPDPNQWQLYIDTLGDYNPRYYRLIERTPTLAFLNIRKKSSLKELQGRSRMIKLAALSQ